MQQGSLSSNNKPMRFDIGVTILFSFLIWDVFILFDKTAITPRLLAAGSFIILLSLLAVLFWKKNTKKD